MGAEQQKDAKTVSVPVLPSTSKELEADPQPHREPLSRRETEPTDNMARPEADGKEQVKLKYRLGELKLKKARELLYNDKENGEQEEIEDLPLRSHRPRESGKKSGKKNEQDELIAEFCTAPVVRVCGAGENETRGRKFRTSKML